MRRTIPDIKNLLQSVENITRNQFIPSICEVRTSCNDDEIQLGITSISDIEYNSLKKNLPQNIITRNKNESNSIEIFNFLKKIPTTIRHNFTMTF